MDIKSDIKFTIHQGLNVKCKDKNGKVYELFQCVDYYESTDEISIRTNFKNDELQRGWMGDLEYTTRQMVEYKPYSEINDYKEINSVVSANYKDVLLRSVNIYSVIDNEITWEYTFLKN